MRPSSAQINMIKQQLRTGNIVDASIIQLYSDIPRARFVPAPFQALAYSDMQIPLSHGQCMLTPLEEASILQALALKGHETVLEVGTGSGFMTALLSRLCQKVYSVDYFSDYTNHAQKNLIEFGCHNVELLTGDASHGWYDFAPYDAIVITGALPCLQETHRLQVMPGGKLFSIIGTAPAMQGKIYYQDSTGQWKNHILFETNIPSLIDSTHRNKFVF